MQSVINNLKTLEILLKNKINVNFIKKFDTETLLECCNKIEKDKLIDDIYIDRKNIQYELISNKDSIIFFKKFASNEELLNKINTLLETIQQNNDKITNYSYERIITTLNNQNLDKTHYYDCIKYFNIEDKSVVEQDIITKNIALFINRYDIPISDLTAFEKNLFSLSFISSRFLMPDFDIRIVYVLLNKDNYLKSIIHFLYDNKIEVFISASEYELIHNNSKEIYTLLKELHNQMEKNTYVKMLDLWIENKCNVYDLKVLKNKLKDLDKDEHINKFQNRGSYINFIYGDIIKSLELKMVDGSKENIVIYAIVNNKKNFLKLIQDNQQLFFELSYNSLLFENDFYLKYFNINSLTKRDLEKLGTMTKNRSNINLLNQGEYTFKEIETLYSRPEQYFILYNNLLDLKIDNRLLIIKQLLKKELLSYKLTEEELVILANRLKIKTLYNWYEKDFFNIKGLRIENVVQLLIEYDSIKDIISQISNVTELLYIIRNKDILTKYNSLDEIKSDIENIDNCWKQLVDIMGISKDFIKENKETIKNFLLSNGAEFALTYYRQCENDKQRHSYKLIIKSQLMGEFYKLKYHTDDLQKEIDKNLSVTQVETWIKNTNITSGSIEVGEYDDFYSTMTLGVEPQRTCLSYKDGMYNRCLLACFDSNKKIIYAKINGKIVARAMIRLTKGMYNYGFNSNTSLSFVDIENPNIEDQNIYNKEEYLTLFLERLYIAGVSSNEEKNIKKLIISLLEEKAKCLNALLVLSRSYADIVEKDYLNTKYYMYISKSKAGSQYLDSLNGQATVTDEGEYKYNTFLIWNKCME